MPTKLLKKLKPWQQVLLIYVVWKLVLTIIGYFASYKLGLGIHDFWARPSVPAPLWHTFKFDSDWYNAIATQGYGFSRSAPAFYPLFPLLVYIVSLVTKLNTVTSAFVVNAIAGYFAFYFLYKLAADYLKAKHAAFTALLLFGFFPTAYFMHAMYGEALFCALTFGAFYFARKRRWWIANTFVMAVAASRLPGLIVAGSIGVEYLSSINFDVRKMGKSALSFLLAPLGFIAYSFHLKSVFGDPLAMLHAYNYGEWAYQKVNFNILATAKNELNVLKEIVVTHKSGTQSLLFDEIIAFGSWILLGAAVVWGFFRKLPWSYLVFMLGSFILFGSHSTYTSANRYVLGMFPMFLLLAEWLEKQDAWVGQLALALSANLMTMLFVMFANGVWTG